MLGFFSREDRATCSNLSSFPLVRRELAKFLIIAEDLSLFCGNVMNTFPNTLNLLFF